MNEEQKQALVLNEAKMYEEKFASQMKSLRTESLLSEVRAITEYDIRALGMQLQEWDNYAKYQEARNSQMNEATSTTSLGRLPHIALDTITAIYGNSIIPVLASIQPLQDTSGSVYLKETIARNSKGEIVSSSLVSPLTGMQTPMGLSSNKQVGVELVVADGAAKTFNFDLKAPIVRGSLKIQLDGAPEITAEDFGRDNGESATLYGTGMEGTVNLKTGVGTLKFATAPANGVAIIATEVQLDVEVAKDIASIESVLRDIPVRCEVFALKAVSGLIANYTASKRFGQSLDADMATDLVGVVNAEIGGRIIKLLVQGAVGETVFNKRVPMGVAKSEHYASFPITLSEAGQVITSNIGRGSIKVLVVGINFSSILDANPTFTKLNDDDAIGPHIYGRLGDIVVVRVPDTQVLGSNSAIGFYKSNKSPWEAPVVYAPFMPFAHVNDVPLAPNPLTTQSAVCTVAAVQNLMPKFATKLTLTDVAY